MATPGSRALVAGALSVIVFGALAAHSAPTSAHGPNRLSDVHSHARPASVPDFGNLDAPLWGQPRSDVVVDRSKLKITTHRTGEASWEPTIGVTENGDIYATAWKSFVEPGVLRSSDGGASWSSVSPGGGPGVSMDPYLFADGNRVFNLDAYALTCGRMSTSDDGGGTWLSNPVACGTVISDHPSAFAGPPITSTTVGHPNVIYVCDFRPFGLRSTVYCSKSITGGLTFTPTAQPAFPVDEGEACTALAGHGVADSEGKIYIPRVTPCGPQLTISEDEGDSWRVIELPRGPGTSGDHEASVAVDDDGNIHYLWVGADRRPYLTLSTNGGKTFSKPRMIAPPSVDEANAPALAVNQAGHLVAIYVGSTNAPKVSDESPQPCSNTATECPASEAYKDVTWNGYVAVNLHPASPGSVFKTHTINPARDPIDDEACGPGRCFSLGDFIDITSGPDGTFWAAFLDGCSGADCVDFYGAELMVVEIKTH